MSKHRESQPSSRAEGHRRCRASCSAHALPTWSPVSQAGARCPRPSHPICSSPIAPTGQVTIVVSRSEMGTGIRTSLAMVLADELDADWQSDPRGAGARRRQIRRPEHRRLEERSSAAEYDARGRRHGAPYAGDCRGTVAGALRRPRATPRPAPWCSVPPASAWAMANWRTTRRSCRCRRPRQCAEVARRLALHRQAACRSSIWTTSCTAARSMASTWCCRE